MIKSWKKQRTKLCVFTLLLSVGSASQQTLAVEDKQELVNNSLLSLQNCHLKGIKQQVSCGTLIVPQNYTKKDSQAGVDGKTISINFSILPAIDNKSNNLPLMFLAGGPGHGAA